MKGHACPGCPTGTIKTTKTIKTGFLRIRYLRCSERCGWTGKQIVQLDQKDRIIFAGPFLQTGNQVLNSVDDVP